MQTLGIQIIDVNPSFFVVSGPFFDFFDQKHPLSNTSNSIIAF